MSLEILATCILRLGRRVTRAAAASGRRVAFVASGTAGALIGSGRRLAAAVRAYGPSPGSGNSVMSVA